MPEERLRSQMNDSQVSLLSKRPGVVHVSFSFGGPEAVRAMMKACLELWATLVGNDEVKSQPYNAARTFVLTGDSTFLQGRTHIDSRPLPCLARLEECFGEIFNMIYLRSDENGRVIGHFTLYNILGYQMVLAECGGRPNVSVGLASNPLDPNKWSDDIAREFDIDWQWLAAPTMEDYAHAQARIGRMIEIYSHQAMKREFEYIVNSVSERHGIFGDVVVSDENTKRQIVGEISHRFAAHLLRLPHAQRLEPSEVAAMISGRKAPKGWQP